MSDKENRAVQVDENLSSATLSSETLDSKISDSKISGSESKGEHLITRRSAVVGAGSIAVLAGLGGLRFTAHNNLVRPPGGQNQDALFAACIRCSKCMEACPRQVIKLSHIEDGILSLRTPQMNFYSDYCDFCEEENGGHPRCVSACPTGALIVSETEEIILGKAEINTDWCLAYHDTGCHACYDACPYEALELDELQMPVVVTDKCNGCGACEAVCVSLTNASRAIAPDATSRAITVKATEV